MKNNIDWEKVKQEFEIKGKVKIERKNNYPLELNPRSLIYAKQSHYKK